MRAILDRREGALHRNRRGISRIAPVRRFVFAPRMKSHRTLLPLAAVLAFSIPAVRAADAPKPLDAMVEKAMTAYNAGDAKAFFADYAKMVEAIATPATFDVLYKNGALKEHGKFVSRKLLAANSVVEGETPLLVYEAKFEKSERVKLSVNFIQEDGKPKLMQVTIEKFR